MRAGDVGQLLVRDAEIHGHGRVDCLIRSGRIADVGPDLPTAQGAEVLDAAGGALLPGLADHHLHLAATAAHRESLDLSNLAPGALPEALRRATGEGWLRAVGYDETAHGDLDRHRLDAWTGDTPTRVQHRSGALWVLNSPGLAAVGAAEAGDPGIERGHDGAPTGRLWRCDHWLADRLGSPAPLSLAPLGAQLAAYGITHVTDASPGTGHLSLLRSAVLSGDLPQHVRVLAVGAETFDHPRLSRGPAKLVVADHDLPDLDDLAEQIVRQHVIGRPVAVHCISRVGLALTLAAFDTAGSVLDGDRIEHCASAGPDLVAAVADRGLRVVTQPALAIRRGDAAWAASEPVEREELWPYDSLLRAGVRTAPSSDAPYGDLDPWRIIRDAADRRTRSGRVLAGNERVPPEVVLAGLLSPLDDPGGAPRAVAIGQLADLVLLDRPLEQALRDLDPGAVRGTLVGGRVVHRRADVG